ncbi:MAG: hypothetical protein ACSLE1_14935 [Sphingobium sp.]
MSGDDLSYLLRRASQERQQTEQAATVNARNAHHAMAAAYEHRVRVAMITLPGIEGDHSMSSH